MALFNTLYVSNLSAAHDITSVLTLLNFSYIGEYCNVAAAGMNTLFRLSSSPVDLSLRLAIALFIYDVIVTFAQEVVCFWTSKRAGAALLFFVNKWISVTYYVMLLARFAPFSTEQVSPLRPCHNSI